MAATFFMVSGGPYGIEDILDAGWSPWETVAMPSLGRRLAIIGRCSRGGFARDLFVKWRLQDEYFEVVC